MVKTTFQYLATTPRSTSPAIAKFCSQISPEHPLYSAAEPYPESFFQRNIQVRKGKRQREVKRKKVNR